MRWIDKFRGTVVSAVLTLFILATVGAALNACNTTAGAGQDVSAAGRAVTNSAEKVKSGL